jgi:hypothetical protein
MDRLPAVAAVGTAYRTGGTMHTHSTYRRRIALAVATLAAVGALGTGVAAADQPASVTGPAATHGNAVHPDDWIVHGGVYFYAGDYVKSAKADLTMQSDGNLVVYDENGHARWASNTVGRGSYATFQDDGNFVVYDSGNHAVWASNTSGHPGAVLAVQDDGNVVIYAANGAVLWATGTNH